MEAEERAAVIDGLAMTYLPDGLGTPSEFEFEWGGVAFMQRVWETELEPGTWRVDLQVQVMRGERLTDRDALREFWLEYHDKDDDWSGEPFGDDGFAGPHEVALLIESGLAAEVRDPFERRGLDEVKRTARGLRLIEL